MIVALSRSQICGYAARYYYPPEYLTSWLEEHLAHQRADGQLYDWVAAGAAANFSSVAPRAREVYHAAKNRAAGEALIVSADKNSAEADQESSAVASAYQVFQITEDRGWLAKDIEGRRIVDRLDNALQYLLTHRFDSTRGLLTNAFTADWGDVSPVYRDQRAIYLDGKTPLVVGLYTNALFYRAAEQLAELHSALGDNERAAHWREKASTTKANINQHLWQEDKGFYRIHLSVTPISFGQRLDESNIFAAGGNALAALYGIADDRRAGKIFEVAEERRRAFGVSTIAGALLPPYPKGFFKHPAVAEEYAYQNGGQWDWFAGRLLLAEFERGHADLARRQLSEIAKKSVESGGLYEWHTKEGAGRGSASYAGNVGALGGAIFEGLFGVYLSRDSLNLKVRLADEAGQVHLYQPATDHYVAYKYCYNQTSNVIELSCESNVSQTGRLSVLLPNNRQATELTLDGETKSFTTEEIGEDIYITIDTDWKPHRLKLKLTTNNNRKS